MGDRTSIEWCHATINAISGCSPLSPGCTNCFAMRAGAHNRPHHPSRGLTRPAKRGGPHVWTGAVRLNEEWLLKPLKWAKPRRIFWNAHGDPFHSAVPQEWVDRELAIAALTPQHRHLFLTKRADHQHAYFTDPETPERVLAWARHLAHLPDARNWSWPLPNVWLGTSVEDQPRANERIPQLLATPAALHWLSCEPLLGPLQVAEYLPNELWNNLPSWKSPEIRWIVAGGESGSGARPMHPAWARSLRDQCAAAGVPFLFKQWGEHSWAERVEGDPSTLTPYRAGKHHAGRLLDGKLHDAYPELFDWELKQQRQAAQAENHPRNLEQAA